MRIAHVVGSLEARYGGPSRSVRTLATVSAALGAEVDLLTSAPVPAPTERQGQLQIHTWRRPWPGAICRVPGMARHLRQANYDILHHHGLWLRTLHYAHQKARQAGIPFVISPRGMMSPWAWQLHRRRKMFAAACIHPGAFAGASGWHATSREEAEEIRARGFRQPICVAPNGVNIPDATAVATAREHWLARVPAARNRPVALFFSRFHHKKRVIELIDLWSGTDTAEWLLLLVGVPEEYSVEQLRAYARRVQPPTAIEVHDGANQPPPYGIASLFLLPSHSENFGLVVAEAAAHGIPPLVTDTTPWSTLQATGMGWCVPWAHYPATLQRALREPLTGLRERGHRVRKWAAREFSWEKAARELLSFYGTLKPPVP